MPGYHPHPLAEHAGDLPGQAHAHYNLAWVWGQYGDDQRALEHATQGLRLFQALGTARASCEAALALHRQHHNRDGEAVNPGLPPPVKLAASPDALRRIVFHRVLTKNDPREGAGHVCCSNSVSE